MAAAPDRIIVKLDPNGVAAPVHRAVSITTHVVAFCLESIAGEELDSSEMHGGFISYKFSEVEASPEERRETYQNWVLSKGFQDLARGIRETLEEAKFYLAIVGRRQAITTWARFQTEMEASRTQAQKLTFPALLSEVNAGLREPMTFDSEFASLQKVRNCLEHRGGRVGRKDINPETGLLILSFPRLKLFYNRGEEEIEVAPGEVIDTYAPGVRVPDEGGGVTIFMKRVTRSREYALGEPVVITASDFFEIAMACHLFASDVAAKLPTADHERNPLLGNSGAANSPAA
ncbi:hypothetical protein [Nitratireductor luteus]|uniref:hypothetical protein n=1 Tax=Nitratireductor luteus TaxID=2976980 RepID=UPI00223FC52A|nr:hypothetical protein [Nitratireductor luteus]